MQVGAKYKYVPVLMWADHGTKNTLIDLLHRALSYNHDNELRKDCFYLINVLTTNALRVVGDNQRNCWQNFT